VGQLQHPPPQHPPPAPLSGAAAAEEADDEEPEDETPTDTVDSSFTVSAWPWGQIVGAFACDIGRRISKVEPQLLQRYS
jgi:hypothetical protein